METKAREAWRSALEAWPTLDPPSDGDPDTRQRRVRRHPDQQPTPTEQLIASLGGPHGSVLDIGAGEGRLAVPLAARGHRVTAVEADSDAAEELADAAAEAGTRVTIIIGTWPHVASNTGVHDVVLSAHTAYHTPGIGPFIDAAHRAARRSVVLEVTAEHPDARLAPYLDLIHGQTLPERPTARDLAEVADEVTGADVRAEEWLAPAYPAFDDIPTLLAYYRYRLDVTPERSLEASAILEAGITTTEDGYVVLGPDERPTVSLWWRV